MQVAVAGATGFVGRALVAELVDRDYDVVALSRHEARLPGAITRVVDVGDEAALGDALGCCDTAYYLVHSLGIGDFRRRDLRLAEGFGRAAAAAGVARIVYLGGLGDDPESDHLASRQEVGVALGDAGVPVVELRAAVILGAGSISFEMLRYLTERLPVMVCPRWVRTAIQPISLGDVLAYLTRSLEVPPGVYEIGGADVTTYREMIGTYAHVRGLRRRRILDVPYLTPRLSSYWVDLVTPVDQTVSHALIESLTVEVIVHRAEETAAAFGIEPVGSGAAIEAALDDQARIVDEELLTREPGLADGIYTERAVAPVAADATERADADLDDIGGSYQWYGLASAWRLRAGLGRLVGERWRLRRPAGVEPGALVDWWSVTRREPSRLVLRGEDWFFGEGWLGFDIREFDLVVIGAFRTKGAPGFLYWKLLRPLHRRIFVGLARHRAARAERPSWSSRRPA
jgi:uncharacterized protein YbjT (DUF2867 family)